MERVEGLTFNQLAKIAKYFGRGVLFFLETGPIEANQLHTPDFRTFANQKPELSPKVKVLIERAEWQRAVFRSLREDLENDGGTQFDPPAFPENNAREAARIAREWLGLHYENTFDAYRAAVEAHGILVFRSNGYSGKWQIARESPILGFGLYDPDFPLILVKKVETETRQTFTLMHELGHLLLQRTSSIDDEHDLRSPEGHERDANRFAGFLLVPDEFLARIRDENRPTDVSRYDAWLAPQRNSWGVSGEVILRRLLDAGRLSRALYNAYRDWWQIQAENLVDEPGGTRQYRHREPKHIFGDTFVRTVLDALNAQHITLSKASNYLDGLKISDIHQLKDYYAGR
jgi:Zn-dependent peptidase ImmA (M78 family)